MRRLVLLALVGLCAQLVDGSLGMGYGVTSATLLVAAGIGPAAASAAIHFSELGTTLVSGLSHHTLGNTDWRTVGVAGAARLRRRVRRGDAAGQPRRRRRGPRGGLDPDRARHLRDLPVPRPRGGSGSVPARAPGSSHPLASFAGTIDALGGGGWGPVGTSTLLASGRLEPRKVVGSVDTAEFVVAVGGSLGFLVGLGTQGIHWALRRRADGSAACSPPRSPPRSCATCRPGCSASRPAG